MTLHCGITRFTEGVTPLSVPFAGVNVEVRAAKTPAELSSWSGTNALCASFKLTVDNLSTFVNCSGPMLARYMTITDLDGDNLPVCGLDALVAYVPPPPAPAPAFAQPPVAGV